MEQNFEVLVIASAFTAMIVFCGAFVYDIYHKPNIEERSIIVVNKTVSLVPVGVSWAPDYHITGDDGVVYRTDWKIYDYMKIGKKYNIVVIKIHSCYGEYWKIEKVWKDKSQTKGGT